MNNPDWLPPDFALVRELGRGSFGTVVLARQSAIDRLVAIKRLSGASVLDPDAVQRFRREGVALAAAQHPNVVEVYDLRQSGPNWLLVMEYVEGATLREHLQHGALSPQARWNVLAQLAPAIATAHGRGVLHRDIKPGNVLVDTEGRAKLADFGLARLADPWAFRTGQPSVAGTRGYLAPEVLAGGSPTPAADTYAFGVMAHEVLTGRRPSVTQQPEPGSGPAGRALFAALADDPRDRPTMSDLARALAAGDARPVVRVVAPIRTDVVDPTDAEPGTERTAAGPPASESGSPAGTDHLPPVYSPPRARPRKRAAIIAVAASAALTVAAVLLWAPADPADALAVTSVRVDAEPATGRCPEARYTFNAEVRTNGAPGEIVARWRQPDGTRTEPVSRRLGQGQSRLTATLRYVISGDAPTTAEVAFEILQPEGVASDVSTVEYRC